MVNCSTHKGKAEADQEEAEVEDVEGVDISKGRERGRAEGEEVETNQ